MSQWLMLILGTANCMLELYNGIGMLFIKPMKQGGPGYLVLVSDGPGSAGIRVGGHPLKYHLGHAQQHGTCTLTL